jgi:hypothetical protein
VRSNREVLPETGRTGLNSTSFNWLSPDRRGLAGEVVQSEGDPFGPPSVMDLVTTPTLGLRLVSGLASQPGGS